MDYFQVIYTGLGGLGIFFLGMKYLSESLQSIGGTLIKKIITKATSNRITAVIVGLTVTAMVQSSSITTAMVVGLVNAGLMQLYQAVGVILGANIGTTITGWILAIKIGKYGLLLIGLGIFPMLISKNSYIASIGKVLLALGFVFLGLETMSAGFKPLSTTQGFLDALQFFHAKNLPSILGCVVIGCLLTFCVQSSSAMLGITIALASTGAITYNTAAALVLGENIGTTITALLAAVGGKVEAKRAAVSHTIFNSIGVLIIILIFPYFTSLVDYLIPGNPDLLNADGSKPNITAHIAAGHTLFNVTATLITLPFLNYLVVIVKWIVPESLNKEKSQLKYLSAGGMIYKGIPIDLAFLELKRLANITKQSLLCAKKFAISNEPKQNYFTKTLDLEAQTDSIEKDITVYVCKAITNISSVQQSNNSHSVLRIASELESIADQAKAICQYKTKLINNNIGFSCEANSEFNKLYRKIYKFFIQVIGEVLSENKKFSDEFFNNEAKKIETIAEQIKSNHLVRIEKGICNPIAVMTFSDMVIALRRIKNNCLNIVEVKDISD